MAQSRQILDPIPLLDYLQKALPHVPNAVRDNASTDNTRNQAYRATDIVNITHWQQFNLATILNQYGTLLRGTQMLSERINGSPVGAVVNESAVTARVSQRIIPLISRSLRAAFASRFFLTPTNQVPPGRTITGFDVGVSAQEIYNHRPDLAFFEFNAPVGTGLNRVPGDIKPSYKWSSQLATGDATQRTEYRQALSQVYFYMGQHGARHGYILTELELVPFRAFDNSGNIEVATPIPWTLGGTENEPELTVLLALWYLGMLASNDNGTDRWCR